MPKFFGTPFIAQPSSYSDASSQNLSLTSRGDLKTVQLSDNHSSVADEGTYFKACTPATTNGASSGSYQSSLPTSASASSPLVDTSATIAMVNSSGNPLHTVCLDYIRFMVTSAAGAAATAGGRVNYAITSNTYDRFSSALAFGTPLVPVPANSTSTSVSVAKLYTASPTQPIILSGFTGTKLIVQGRGKFKDNGNVSTTVPSFSVGDIYTLDFGDHAVKGQEYISVNANQYSATTGPLILGPGQFLAIHIWAALGTATFDVDMGWWER